MTRRRLFRAGGLVAAACAFGVLIPGSPAYLPNLLVPDQQFQGRSGRQWVRALDDPDAETRRQAIHAVGAIGTGARDGAPRLGEAVPRLAAILVGDPDRDVRREAALALMKLHPDSRGAVAELGRALSDEDPRVRLYSALTLARLGPEARPAAPALTGVLEAPDIGNQVYFPPLTVNVREAAALALGRATAGSGDAVPALTAALTAADTPEMQAFAARGLGAIGPAARPAAAHLRPFLQAEHVEVREAVGEALVAIGADPDPDPDRAGAGGAAAPPGPQLPESDRAFLWEVEHHGNVLVKHGFGPLAEAVAGGDGAALGRLLAPGFVGTDLRNPRRVRAATGFVAVERVEAGGRPPAPLTRDGFAARLFEARRLFPAAPPRANVSLMTLAPKDRNRFDGPWEGTAQLRLHGEHAPGAPAEAVLVLRFESERPTREALAKPGWLRAAGVTQALTAKAPHYLFAEVGRARGYDAAKLHDNWRADGIWSVTGGVYVTDYDRDGILDVLVTDTRAGVTLYRGRAGGGVEDVTARTGLPADFDGRIDAAWADLDGDGWEDLLLAGRVYRNDAGRFVDYTARSLLFLPADTSNVVVGDYDRDGRLDLYVTRTGQRDDRSWLDGRASHRRGNVLFRNKGDWRFEDVTAAAGATGGYRSTFTAAWLDADDDGWPDLHVTNEFGDGVLLVNNRNGTFAERSLAARPADFGTMGLAVGDVDNDGNIDIYCANMYSKAGTRVIGNLRPDAYPPDVFEKLRRFVAGSQLHLNKGGLAFEQAGREKQVAAVGWAYGACLADLDGDGFLDIYATAGYVSRDRSEPDG